MKDNAVKISVIIPCYNQDVFLSEALDSLLEQTYSDWEAIIIDDGSTDSSSSVAKRYASMDSRFKYIFQDNAGPSKARNIGALEACGKYLLFLDSDDKLFPGYMEKGIKYMENNIDTRVYYTGIQFFGGKDYEYKVKYSTYENLLLGNSITCCCIVRKVDFDKIGGFDVTLHGYEDWDFFIRLLYGGGRVYKDPELLFLYRMGVNMDSVSKHAKRNKANLEYSIYTKNISIYQEYFGDSFSILKDMVKYRNEKEWYSTAIAKPIAKLGFRIQLLFDRLLKKANRGIWKNIFGINRC